MYYHFGKVYGNQDGYPGSRLGPFRNRDLFSDPLHPPTLSCCRKSKAAFDQPPDGFPGHLAVV